MAIVSIVELHYDPAGLESALAGLHTTLADTRAFEGCLSVDVVQNVSDPGHILLVERWESVEKDQAYRAWRASGTAPVPDGPPPAMTGPVVVTVSEVLADV
jgi:quinol monooxygenase YgiN